MSLQSIYINHRDLTPRTRGAMFFFFWVQSLTKHLLWWEMLLVGKGGPTVVYISSVLPSYVNLGIKKTKTKMTGR